MKLRIRRRIEPKRQTGKYVVYWMQQAQRAEFNPALDEAIAYSNNSELPLLVVFVLCPVAEANWRHYLFMLQGLWETARRLKQRGLELIVLCGEPVSLLSELSVSALEMVCDLGYLRFQRSWREKLLEECLAKGCGWTELETEPSCPIEVVSDKEEYAAATFRPKLLRALNTRFEASAEISYQVNQVVSIEHHLPYFMPAEKPWESFEAWALQALNHDLSVMPTTGLRGGREAAEMHLTNFLRDKLPYYASFRSNPALDIQSGLSPYLHFGQISAVEVLQQLLGRYDLTLPELCSLIAKKPLPENPLANPAAFAEELLVRRELSFNFCHYNSNYDCFAALPAWARQSLLNHLGDKRDQDYSLDRLEQCATDDIYWNAAQQEMMETGKMHNYLRMYWGKRLLTWFASPEDAYQVALYLNNRYELDGRDPNAYAGVAWCFGKHDRPWQNRPIYGSVRYMNATGLERKFKMEKYLHKVYRNKES